MDILITITPTENRIGSDRRMYNFAIGIKKINYKSNKLLIYFFTSNYLFFFTIITTDDVKKSFQFDTVFSSRTYRKQDRLHKVK